MDNHNQALLKPADFTKDALVIAEVQRIQNTCRGAPLSDVFDAAGHQYVDLVMEGGGVLGVALVGYCYALEQAGIRFRSIAGTSAGAINALFMQAVSQPGHRKSTAMIREIAAMPIAEFQDGGSDARNAVSALISGDSLLRKLSRLIPNLSELTRKFGINPGDRFHQWAQARLAHYGINSQGELEALLAIPPRGIHRRDPETGERLTFPWHAELALITTELRTARKVVFPRHSPLFYAHPHKVSPADFVRASMSVPYFFEPWRVDQLPRNNRAKRAWREFKPKGPIPEDAIFVDGGLISNFPISEFHRRDGVPPWLPTFGVKLSADEGAVRNIDGLGAFTGALIEAMRFDADTEFLHKNPDYRQLIAEIHTDGYHWLNFHMSRDEKIGLFREGVMAAGRFLDHFDWRAYQESRMTPATRQ
ncbi:MAG: patatin-like phospholipase family protein [Halieaceae bacterium]|jgi:NTE family protein|nr:patatin-like phospholipase family protein [Halieaceae bacterium]